MASFITVKSPWDSVARYLETRLKILFRRRYLQSNVEARLNGHRLRRANHNHYLVYLYCFPLRQIEHGFSFTYKFNARKRCGMHVIKDLSCYVFITGDIEIYIGEVLQCRILLADPACMEQAMDFFKKEFVIPLKINNRHLRSHRPCG